MGLSKRLVKPGDAVGGKNAEHNDVTALRKTIPEEAVRKVDSNKDLGQPASNHRAGLGVLDTVGTRGRTKETRKRFNLFSGRRGDRVHPQP